MAIKKYYTRKFLNKKEGMAALEIDGEFNSDDSRYNKGFSVTISDCHRQITLDFWQHNKIEKIDTLIKELTKVRDWYVANVSD